MPLERAYRCGVRSPAVDAACFILPVIAVFAVFFFSAISRGANNNTGLTFAPDGTIATGWTAGPANYVVQSLEKAVPARGIMLNVPIIGRRTRHRGQRFEIRSCRVDVEPQGFAPYEVTADVYIPSNLVRDVLPGSTLEVRVDSSNLGNVLVIGPDVGYAQGSVRTAS